MARLAYISLFAAVLLWTVLSEVSGKEKGKGKDKEKDHQDNQDGATGYVFPPNTMEKLSEAQSKHHPKFKPNKKHRAVGVIPSSFDSRTNWPSCTSISTIRNQGQCGTCWAVCAASVLSDRLCIASKGSVQSFISSTNFAGCVDKTKSDMAKCDPGGGNPIYAFSYAAMYGVPTGGENKPSYTAADGCQPYFIAPGAKPVSVSCSSTCSNSAYKTAFDSDKKVGQIDTYWQNRHDTMSASEIKSTVEIMQQEIMAHGPICIGITVYEDFQQWKATDAPYCNPKPGAAKKGGHAMRIIGWGTDGNTPYWLIANSWGTSVGDKGIYKIVRGQNCVGIEDSVSAPIVSSSVTCGKFCDKAPDQVIRLTTTDAKSAIYAFTDNCTVEVKVGSDGKMTPVGAMVPIEKQFLGANGPIGGWGTPQDKTTFVLTGKDNSLTFCNQPAGTTKYKCDNPGSASFFSPVATVSTSTKKTYYWRSDKPEYLWVAAAGSSSSSGSSVGNTFTAAFKQVNSFLDIDGTRMQVCGTGTDGKPACGTITYTELDGRSSPKKWEAAPSKMSATC